MDVLVVKTRACSLCDKALRVLQREQRRLGLRLRTADITDDEDLLAAYGEEVPVVFIAGRRRFHGRVDPVLLRRTVEAERRREAAVPKSEEAAPGQRRGL